MQKLTDIIKKAFACRTPALIVATAMTLLVCTAVSNQAFAQEAAEAGAAGTTATQDGNIAVEGAEDSESQATDAAVAEILAEDARSSLDYPSLFFTDEERRAIELALEKGGVLDLSVISKTLGEEECLTCALDEDVTEEEGPKIPKGPREIELAGVLYFSAYDWTIWLNGERVTPYFIPEEVIKLDVSRQNVYIEWFDRFYDRIVRVNLRPHQTFYMDANVILNNQPTP